MPDITLCHDESCPRRESCYRFIAEPSERQSYFTTSPRQGTDCVYYDKADRTTDVTVRAMLTALKRLYCYGPLDHNQQMQATSTVLKAIVEMVNEKKIPGPFGIDLKQQALGILTSF